MTETGRPGSASCNTETVPLANGSEELVMGLNKDALDKANKDKTNKVFSPNLKVSSDENAILSFFLRSVKKNPQANHSGGIPTHNCFDYWLYEIWPRSPVPYCHSLAKLF